MIDRQHLSIIREVHRCGSVTAAAERLNLSQSAVSHAIGKLERYHQVDIWRKKGRKLSLTQAGHYLLSLAERWLPELENAERLLQQMAAGQRGSIRLGMECHPCEKWLMRVTKPYLLQWPDVDLEIRTAFRFDGIAALQACDVDILVTPDPVITAGVVYHPVFDYELKIIVPKTHRLATRSFVRPEDLCEETLFTLPVGKDRLDIFARFLLPAGCQPRKHVGIETTELMLQLVAADRGITVLPDWLTMEEGRDLPIKMLKIGRAGLPKSINFGFRVEDADIDYLQGFIEMALHRTP